MTDCALCGRQISSAAENNDQIFCDLHSHLAHCERHVLKALKHCIEPNLATNLRRFADVCAEELGRES